MRHPALPVAFLAAALSLFKLFFLDQAARALFSCVHCDMARAALHEAEFLCILLAAHLVAAWCRPRWAGIALRSLVIAALVVGWLDLFTLDHFMMRLSWQEVQEFAAEPRAVLGFLLQLTPLRLAACLAAFTALGFCGARYLLSRSTRPRPRMVLASVAVTFATLGIGHASERAPDFHEPYLVNALEAFFDVDTRSRPYSPSFLQSGGTAPLRAWCAPAMEQRRDVVLVVIESLSAHQSLRLGGFNDWTPRIDALGDQGLRMRNFRANGITTEEGLISLLTGQPAIPRPQPGRTELMQFEHERDTVPRMLARTGYRTVFLTTGNLDFTGKGAWLDDIGFEYREGHESPFYSGMQRFNFDAAPDRALYDRALQEISQPAGRPLFLALETVSSHHPYTQPETGEHTPESVFRYADAQLGRFADLLRQAGFFARGGVLIVTGDHRAMVPMTQPERDKWGDRAFSAIPLVAIGEGLHGESDQPFSQSDLLPSLQHWLGSGRQCVAQDQGVFLPVPAKSPACAFTRRPYDPDIEVAECGLHDWRVELDGDDTDFEDGSEGPAALIARINRLRLGRGF